MQAKIKTEPYEYFDPVFDGSYEVPIDTEYNLPDYCADIQKILKCRVLPEISSYLISEDTLTCDGVCDIFLLPLKLSPQKKKRWHVLRQLRNI